MKTRAVIDPLTMLLVGACAAALLAGSIHLPAMFQKKPPVAQLSAAEVELVKAKEAQKHAEDALAAAKAQEAAKTAAQLDYAQQFATGTTLALARVPANAQTPEVKLASEMAARAVAGLDAARGQLPAAAQAEIQKLVDQALSAVTAERDAYRAALAVKDGELQAAIAEKSAVQSQIPVLESKAATAKAETVAVSAKVETLGQQVVAYATAKAAADADASGWKAWATFAAKVGALLAMLYFIGHIFLPMAAQSYPGLGWLTTIANLFKNLTTAHL